MHLTSDIALVQWYDNSFVTMESNAYGARPTNTGNRILPIDKKRTRVTMSCPQVVSKYYGVDRLAENADRQRILFRRKNGVTHYLRLPLMLLAKMIGKHFSG